MPNGVYDLRINQGATFRRILTLFADEEQTELIDLTGYSARLQARTFSGGAVIDLDSGPGGGLTIGDELGTIELLLTDEQTEALNFAEANYDLEIESAGGEVTRLLQGRAVLRAEVSA